MILANIAFIFLSLRLFIALVNFLTRPMIFTSSPAQEKPKVSILIPARNEEATLPALLESLTRLTYPEYEVIVCDDHSTDRTPELLDKFARRTRNLQWFTGQQLPAGWLGKNFACHQLAGKATGDYLLFIDADVQVEPDFLSPVVTRAVRQQLALLSIFPRQRMDSTGEKSTVPLMNWILMSLLPLSLVRLSKKNTLAAANGQFMLFEAGIYRKNQWHRQVKAENVEDILIMRRLKETGFRAEVLANFPAVSCRMYSSYREAVKGFSRNIHQYFGGKAALMLLFWFITVPGILVALLMLPIPETGVLLGQILLLRTVISLHSGQSVWTNLYYHPLQMAALTHIMAQNLLGKRKKTVKWKDREVPFG